MTVVENARLRSELGVATLGGDVLWLHGRVIRRGDLRRHLLQRAGRNLARAPARRPAPAGFTSRGITPALLAGLPASIQHTIAAAYADSIHTVFLIAVPIGAVARKCSRRQR